MKIGKCKLCLLDNKELLTKSHIIPEFFHSGLKDNKERYDLIMPDKYIKGRRQHRQKPLGAMYEGNILCENCDNVIISSYENYLSELLIENKVNSKIYDTYIDDKNVEFKIYKNIDDKKFKLALLSILWRTSISNLEFFKEVNLSKDNSENIRLMLLNNDTNNIESYQIISFAINEIDEKKIIINPRFLNEDGKEYCKLIINGYMFLFIIEKLENTKKLIPYIQNQTGIIYIEVLKKNYIKEYVQNIIVATKIKLNEN
jgi:hypothetical protein